MKQRPVLPPLERSNRELGCRTSHPLKAQILVHEGVLRDFLHVPETSHSKNSIRIHPNSLVHVPSREDIRHQPFQQEHPPGLLGPLPYTHCPSVLRTSIILTLLFMKGIRTMHFYTERRKLGQSLGLLALELRHLGSLL